MFVSREQETTSYEFLRKQYTCANPNENSIMVKKYMYTYTYRVYTYTMLLTEGGDSYKQVRGTYLVICRTMLRIMSKPGLSSGMSFQHL